mmetsp:Transcript_23468/g.28686  ORF Transcript_23468/g.28686 Transcript_23468/m.28686 type:complete len:173 (+) Transcript_23468:126-644(+)
MRCCNNDRESNIPICLRSVETPTHIYNIISSTNEIRSANSLPLMKNITNNEQKDCIIHNSKVTLKLARRFRTNGNGTRRKISLMNRTNQEMSLSSLRLERHQMLIKPRKESYWHWVDIYRLLLQKETAEKRMNDLDERLHKEMNDSSSMLRLPLKIDRGYVAKLQSQLTKSI